MRGYKTRDVAEFTGLTQSQVRHFVRRGLIQPARDERALYRFSFQDVVLLRTAKGLLDDAVPVRKALKTLVKLSADLKGFDSLAAVRIYAEGNTVVVRQDDQHWDADTGQHRFSFTIKELAGQVRTLAKRREAHTEPTEHLDSDDWYNLALDLEEVDPDKAPDAYSRSISLNPKNADAHVNLGRLFQIRGDLRRAKRHYQLALAAVPAHQLAFYNLGTVFDELDELEQALDYYRRAPNVPDAHYNLARIFEIRGDELSSMRHMRQYRRLIDVD